MLEYCQKNNQIITNTLSQHKDVRGSEKRKKDNNKLCCNRKEEKKADYKK